MRSALSEPTTLVAIAEAAGMSVRTLTRGFRQRFGMSPMRSLRVLRLDAVHHALVRATADELSVTQAAFRFGLPHLGRFAGDYRQRFGERPSETLRRRPPEKRSFC